MDDEVQRAIEEAVEKHVHLALLDVVEVWDDFGHQAAMNHGAMSPGEAMCAGFGDVLRIAIERRMAPTV